ncbi:hypothetical protein BDA99DRAFT_416438, partial [Phascolomyces articulosus]
FDNQVAGHDRILQFSTNDLMVIKPSTQIEQQFYEDSQNDLEFCCWIPKCYGSLHVATDSELAMLEQQQGSDGLLKQEGAAQQLCLENLLNGFTRPCIMDLKIG